MIKVAHVCTSRISYRILQDKLYEISKLGYDVSIISSEDAQDTEFFKKHGINQYYVDMNRKINIIDDIKSIRSMIKLIKREKFDVIHTHTAKAGFIGRISAKLSGTKLIVHTSHGLPYYEGQNKIKYTIYKLLEIIASKFCHYVGSQNREDLEKIQEYVNESRTFYEGNGVNLERLDEINKSIADLELDEIRDELGINKENVVFLVGARLEAVKNHNLLLDALKLLKDQEISNYYCLLAGGGPLEEDLRLKVKEYNLQENVKFLGFRNDIYKLIKLSDVALLTSEKEGIPRIIMESMAFSKPVVATDVLGTRELVVNEVTGLLSRYLDEVQLANNIKEMISNEQLRKQYGKEGRIRIENEFTEALVAKRVDKLYKENITIEGVNYDRLQKDYT